MSLLGKIREFPYRTFAGVAILNDLDSAAKTDFFFSKSSSLYYSRREHLMVVRDEI